MKIEFYNTETGIAFTQEQSDNLGLFVMGNLVCQNNGYGCESQSAYVDFSTFVDYRHDLGWRVVD